jgi:hypothetical protein
MSGFFPLLADLTKLAEFVAPPSAAAGGIVEALNKLTEQLNAAKQEQQEMMLERLEVDKEQRSKDSERRLTSGSTSPYIFDDSLINSDHSKDQEKGNEGDSDLSFEPILPQILGGKPWLPAGRSKQVRGNASYNIRGRKSACLKAFEAELAKRSVLLTDDEDEGNEHRVGLQENSDDEREEIVRLSLSQE